MNSRCFAIQAAFLALGASALSAQNAPPQEAAPPGSVIKTETRVVLVDAVVTDKKGNYIHDLTAKDFKVWEDKKEQNITSFSFEADPNSPASNQKRYIVIFFDNSTVAFGEQVYARDAATKFVLANAGPNRLMSIVNYGGSLQIAQNFTDDAERLKAVISGVKFSSVSPNGDPTLTGTTFGGAQLARAAAEFGSRDMILALRSLAKNLATVPGRKTLILLTGGFPVGPEILPEVTATIDVCNRSNVAIYPIDVRGLVSGGVGASTPGHDDAMAAPNTPTHGIFTTAAYTGKPVSFTPVFFFQRPGAGGGGGGAGGAGAGGGRTGGGGSTSPGAGSSGGRSGSSGGATGGRTGTSGTPTGTTTGSRGGGGMPAMPRNGIMNPMNQARSLIPPFPSTAATNQELMYMLADGTGGFVIINTNDLLGGFDKIGKEQNEFYLLGYTPPESEEGTCHTLRVKVDRGGTTTRARTGYCNSKPRDLLAGNSAEKTLEARAMAAQPGNTAASMETPFFYTSPNVARVNVAMEISPENMTFEKEHGKFHGTINVLGLAYRPDGSVGARFSDAVKLAFENKKEMEEFKEKPMHYENQFDIASGEYNLKVVFSAGGQSFGKLEAPLKVDPYAAGQFSLSGLALSKDLRRASDMGADLDAALIEDRTPLITQGVQIIPSGSNHFSKTDHPVMYFEIYEPLLVNAEPNKLPAVAIQVRIVDRKTGQQKDDSGLMRLDIPAKVGNPVIPAGTKIPADKLEPGTYRVELLAMDQAGKKVTRTADFDIQ